MLGAAVGAIVWYANLKAAANRRKRQAKAEAEGLMTDTCCTVRPAVEYDGWRGSVHTFWFANDWYADKFIRANAGKVLG